MDDPGNPLLAAARRYLKRGWTPVYVEPGVKGPTDKGWQNQRFTEADLPVHFDRPGNIGIILGEASGGLVDVDLDCPEALELADQLLPPTDAVTGRPGAPRSHRWYVADVPGTKQFRDPQTRKMIVELRSTGGQTLVGPSRHDETDEPYDVLDGEPARASGRMLLACVEAIYRDVVRLRYGEMPEKHRPAPRRTVAPTDLSGTDVERRALAYLAATPPAISGSGGHSATYAAATALVHGFCIPPDRALAILLDHYNPRCQPPWTEKELAHKVEDAAAKPHDLPHGWLRDADSTQEAPDVDISALCANVGAGSAPVEPPKPPPRIRLTRADQIEMRPPRWLLRGILERDTFAMIFGDPGCGKSFLAIDWACMVATGASWRGQAVRGGPAVYVAGEGQQGFGRRIRAWSEHHGVTLAGVPLYLAPAVAIPDPGDRIALFAAIDTGVVTVGQPALIVLDTLARCFGGGDENSTQDMSRFVSACDAIRGRYGCTILVVHHAGHTDKSRARGAIALKAALDAEYRLANDTRLLLTATKMKDAEIPPPLAMEMVTVDLPGLVDDYGNPVTSAAIEVLDADVSAIVAKANAAMSGKRGKWQQVGIEVAQRLVAEGDDGQASVKDWHLSCDAAGMPRSTRYDVLAKLHAQGIVTVDGERIETSNRMPDSPASNPIQSP